VVEEEAEMTTKMIAVHHQRNQPGMPATVNQAVAVHPAEAIAMTI